MGSIQQAEDGVLVSFGVLRLEFVHAPHCVGKPLNPLWIFWCIFYIMPHKSDKERTKKEGLALDPAASDAISRHLRRVYEEVANEPIPDRFKQLLKRLSETDTDS